MWAVFLSGWCFGCCFKSGRLIVFFSFQSLCPVLDAVFFLSGW